MHRLQQTRERGQWIFIDEFKGDLPAVRCLRQALYLGDHLFRIQHSVKSLVHSHIAETAALQAEFDLLSLPPAYRSRIIDLWFGHAGGVGATDVLQNLSGSDI